MQFNEISPLSENMIFIHNFIHLMKNSDLNIKIFKNNYQNLYNNKTTYNDKTKIKKHLYIKIILKIIIKIS